jgi:hypothetical protein
VGPDLHHAVGWTLEAKKLKGKYYPFEVKLLGSAATENHHAIGGVAEATFQLGREVQGCSLTLTPIIHSSAV